MLRLRARRDAVARTVSSAAPSDHRGAARVGGRGERQGDGGDGAARGEATHHRSDTVAEDG